jgi:hypothetical protein
MSRMAAARPETYCLECARPHLAFWFREAPAGLDVAAGGAALHDLAVWTSGVDERRLADPRLLRTAEATGASLTSLSLAISAGARAHTGQVCSHGVFVDDHLCTSLTYRASEYDARVGLIPVPALFAQEIPEKKRQRAELPVAKELLEAAPDEPTLSLDEMDALVDWKARQHDEPRKPRAWSHLILVSHAWGDPTKPQTPWAEVKKRVNDWVNTELAKPPEQRSPRMKAAKREDFGVWIDFMMVPNEAHAAGDVCERCEHEKTRMIQRINALLSLATVIPMSDTARHRGWILQELTLDAHGATKYEHRDRVSLMARHVRFTTDDGTHATDDGMLLRCNEFVRLSQTPRAWPSVGPELLRLFREAGITEEASEAARGILMDHARRFDKDCHLVKRLMADLTQALALSRRAGHEGKHEPGLGAFEQPFDLSELATAIREQSQAMGGLAAQIAASDTSGSGATDPDGGLTALPLEARRRLTEELQWQQFVGVATGLRAEWLYGCGLAAWVRLSAITEALTATKFLARLKAGQVRFWQPRSLTIEAKLRSVPEQIAFAKRIASEGVRIAEMELLYALGRDAKRELDELEKVTR